VYEQLIRAANLSKPAEKARNKEINVVEKAPEVEQDEDKAVSDHSVEKAVSDHSVEKEMEVMQRMENEIWKFSRPKSSEWLF
jgi:hypothetical protein